MKNLIIFCLLCLSLAGFSQVVEESQVPAEVISVFKKKNAKVKDPVWVKNKDNYQVKFLQAEKRTMYEYSKKGELLMTRVEIDSRSLVPTIENHLSQNYGHLKRESAFLITKGKEKYYSINLYERGNKKKVTEVQYTPSGQFITAWEPEIIIEEKEEKPDRFTENIQEEKVAIEKSSVTGTRIKVKELPSAAQKLLTENHNADWAYKECSIVENEKGLQYYVIMKKKGMKEAWEYYFDINGKLISKEKVD